MKTRRNPAAVPAAALAAGIAASQWAVANPLSLGGLVAATLLVATLRRAWRPLLVTATLAFLAGVQRERVELRATARIDHFIAANDDAVTLDAPVRHAWSADSAGRARLTVDRAVVSHGATAIESREPVTIFVDTPPRDSEAATIRASGQLRRSESGTLSLSVKSPLLIDQRGHASGADPRQWNRGIAARLNAAAQRDPRLAPAVRLTRAIALGDSRALDGETRRGYRDGGTYHLLVFSGMQIAFAAGALALLLRPLRRPRLTDGALLVTACLAPLIAGSEPSVTRAAAMIGLFAFARLLRRPTTNRNLLFLSATLRLLAVPGDLTDAGFQLTYAAAAGLILLGDSLAEAAGQRRALRTACRIAGAELAIAPVTLFYFRRVVVAAGLTTALVSPLVVVMLAASVFFLASAFVFPPLLMPLARVIIHCNGVALALNAFAASHLHLSLLRPRPSVLALLVYAIVAAVAASGRFRRFTLPLLFVSYGALLLPPRQAESPFTVEALDVGQGDSILVRRGRTSILVDGGGRSGDDSFGDRVLVPLLIDRGIRQLDAVILSHAHPDHCGGLPAVVRTLPVRTLWLAGRQWSEECEAELRETAFDRRVPIALAEHQRTKTIGPLTLQVFTPRLRFKRSILNNGSAVYRLSDATSSVLLTGDVERDAESLLVEAGSQLRSDILKVPHHGSRTSSTEELLDAVAPRVALVSCGVANRYGHPSSVVVERYAARRVRLLRTDVQGCVTVIERDRHLFALREFDTPRGTH